MQKCKMNLKTLIIFGIMLGLAFASLNFASALNNTFYPSKDAYVRQDTSTTNYGTSTSLEIRNGVTNIRRTYLDFITNSIGGSYVNTASLCLYQITDGTTLNGFVYHAYNWKDGTNSSNILNETAITWGNQPCGTAFDNSTNCNLTQIDAQAIDSTNAYECWNVTTPTRAYLSQNLSFVLKTAENSPLTADIFRSKENVTYRPYLFIEYSDLVPPNLQFVSPTETSGTFLNKNFILVNVTSSDDIALKNITTNLYNSTGRLNSSTSLTSPLYLNFLNLLDGIYYFNSTATDTSNNQNSSGTRSVTLDTTNPLISYGTNTAVNRANLSQSNVYINTTWTEVNFANITFNLQNLTWSNSTTYTIPTYAINFTNIADGNYWYFVNITDIANNKNSTPIYYIRLDRTSPNATLLTPANNSYNNTNQNFTANLSDNFGLENATLNIYNQTALVNQTFFSFISGTLQSVVGAVVSLTDGIYNWFFNVNDNTNNSFTTQNNTFTQDTTNPTLIAYINVPIIYYNTTTIFTGNFTDNLALSYFNFTITIGGTYSVITNISGITNSTTLSYPSGVSNAGTLIRWSFSVYDKAGNFNYSNSSFIIQSRPTILEVSTDAKLYQQGSSAIPIYANIQAKYSDELTNQSVLGAICIVTNQIDLSSYLMTYNSTTGNYTYPFDTTPLYDNLSLTTSCSKTNYVSQVKTSNIDVHFFSYLWNNQNRTIGDGTSTNIWSSKSIPNSPIVVNFSKNVSIGDNLLFTAQHYAVGSNGSFIRNFILGGDKIVQMNISFDSNICKPMLCYQIRGSNYITFVDDCSAYQTITPNQFSILNFTETDSDGLAVGEFLTISLKANCSSSGTLNYSIVTNSTLPIITITRPEALTINPIFYPTIQITPSLILYPNTALNRKISNIVNITNPLLTPYSQSILYSEDIFSEYINSVLWVDIYNSSGELFASSYNNSAPNNATISPSNQIAWDSGIIPANTTSVQTLIRETTNVIWDIETLNYDYGIDKSYTIEVNSKLIDGLTFNNLTIITNYSTYGINILNNLNISMINSTGTYDITSQVTIDTINKFLIMPTLLTANTGRNIVTYTISSNDTTNPSISFAYPTPPQNSVLSQNWIYINVSAFDINEKNITFNLYNVSYGLINQTTYSTPIRNINFTNLPQGFYYYNVSIEDITGNKNTTETRRIVLDYTAPTINSVAPSNNYGSNNPTINFSANASNMNLTNANLSIYNSSGGLVTNVNLTTTGSSSIFSSVINLFNGVFTWFWQIWDWAGNSVTSLIYTLTIDTSIPNIIIDYPLNNTIYPFTINTLGYTATGIGNASECWYSLNNGVTNISMSCLNSNVSVLSSNGNNTWLVAMNNSIGNYSQDKINFNVNCVNPNAVLSLTSYPYISVNTTNHLSLSSFAVGVSTIKMNVTTPNMSVSTFNLVYNPSTHAYEQNLIFTDIADYSFAISGDGICPTLSPSITGTFLVRQPYNVTFCGFNQDDYSSYENDYAYLIAEPTTSKRYYDNNLEQFITPLGFATTYDTPVFHTYYRNGCGTFTLFDPNQEYAVRLFDGIATYKTTLSAPNISKTYGTNIYLGKYTLNGTDTSYRVLLSDKDIHQYRWLFNWIFLIAVGTCIIVSVGLFFVVPQMPLLSLIFGVGFITMLTLARIILWFFFGW